MSAEVHRLTGAGPIIEPNAEIIDDLEQLLAAARAGAFRGIAYFVIDGADTVSTTIMGGCASASHMVAGAARLNYRVLARDQS